MSLDLDEIRSRGKITRDGFYHVVGAYYVVREAVRRWDGWTRAFVAVNGEEKRRSMRWLKEHRREEEK